jgi:hydrogenase expression/formation protein HypC
MCLAVPARVISVSADEPLVRSARVDFGGVFKDISVALVPDVQPGEHVLVHVGLALARIDEAEARRLVETLRTLDELEPDGMDEERP